MKDKKEGNSICKWFKKKEPLSEKTNFDGAGESICRTFDRFQVVTLSVFRKWFKENQALGII